ncbi:MAG: hypothetical protein ACRDS9_11350 [Pseudonocardiaceae bacterium]
MTAIGTSLQLMIAEAAVLVSNGAIKRDTVGLSVRTSPGDA